MLAVTLLLVKIIHLVLGVNQDVRNTSPSPPPSPPVPSDTWHAARTRRIRWQVIGHGTSKRADYTHRNAGISVEPNPRIVAIGLGLARLQLFLEARIDEFHVGRHESGHRRRRRARRRNGRHRSRRRQQFVRSNFAILLLFVLLVLLLLRLEPGKLESYLDR